MKTPEEIKQIMESFGVDELKAKFIAAIGEGEIDGDIVEVESIEEANNLSPPIPE